MNLKIILKKNRKNNLCIILINKHKILNILGLIKKEKLYLDFNTFKNLLMKGCKVSISAKNLIYKNLKNKEINKNIIFI